MNELELLGTAQNRKVYARHGAGPGTLGVSFANLGKLARRIKTNHDLARQLWDSGISDARSLALMIASPTDVTEADLDHWIAGVSYYILAGSVAQFTHKTCFAVKKRKQWTASRQEYVAQAGWDLVALAAMHDAEAGDGYFEQQLDTIEKRIHKAPNRVRHAMNGALIAIGIRNAHLEKLAVAAAKRIGKVEVDHGETSCVTPDAVAYIAKTKARKATRSRPR
ncbi:MAG: DNA alkylation repair protein [Bryobacteraceae bacterium]